MFGQSETDQYYSRFAKDRIESKNPLTQSGQLLMSSPVNVQAFNSNGYNNLTQSQQIGQINYNSLNLDNNNNFNINSSNGNLLQTEIENVFHPNIRYLNKPAITNPITSGAYAAQNYASNLQQKNNFNNNSFSMPGRSQNQPYPPLNNNNNYNGNQNKNFPNPQINMQNQANNNTLNVSLDEILQKIRQKLAQRGTTGILSIGKSFKINDIDNSRSISFSEFSNLCSRYGLGLSGNEIRSAFALFDKRRNGTIDYEEFLSVLRGGLKSFRRSLVDQAFNIMDKNKNGIIDYNDIVSAFDATKHPAVAKGERTAESVYNEFLSSFSMNHAAFAANKGNFNISREEWVEYYENVSMSIDDDAYFEVMMNNCWRMNSHSMGSNNLRGWANKSESTEGGAAAVLQESYNRRYNNISFGQNKAGYNIVTNKIPVGGINNINNNNIKLNNNGMNFNINNNLIKSQNLNNQFNNQINPSNNNNIGASRLNRVPTNNIINGNQNLPLQANPQRSLEKGQAVLEKFRSKLFARGSNSLISLAKQFKIGDDDNSKSLSYEEFVKACKDFRTELNQSEIVALFTLFDRNRNNFIDYDEFVRAIRGEMSEKRKALVRQAFAVLDVDKSGVIEIQDLKNKYNMRKNPDVLNGRKSEEEAYGEFLQTLEFHFNIYKGKMDRKITMEEFLEYYNNISCSIDNDEYFEIMLRNAWNLDRADYNKLQKGWANDYSGVMENNSSNFNGLNNALNTDDQRNMGNGDYNSNNNALNNGNYNYNNKYNNANNNYNTNNNLHNSQQNPNPNLIKQQSSLAAYNNPVNDPIIQRLREKILSRGIKGIIGIQRSFKIADRNHSGIIDNEELVKLLKNYRFELTDVEFRKLFEVFDSDRSGKVDFNEFLYTIVGEMNEMRKNLVKKAFKTLDKTGNGRVDIDDIRGSFNAKMHPDVKNGKKTEDEVLSSFLDNFETHFSLINNKMSKDRSIDLNEFMEYYNNISASIDSDAYFEEMMNSSWNLNRQFQTGWRAEY